MAQNKSYTKTVSTDWNQDGVPDNISTESFVYKKGLLVEQSYTVDYDASGTIDYSGRTVNTYKNGDLVKSVSSQDYNGDNINDYISTTENTYKKGNLVHSLTSVDYDANNTIDYTYSTDNTFNQRDQLTEVLTQSDWNGDSIIDNADRTSYIYEGKDLVAEQWDYGNNGTIDAYVSYDYA